MTSSLFSTFILIVVCGLGGQLNAQPGGSSVPAGNLVEAGVLESAEVVLIHSSVPGQSTILDIVPDGTVVSKGDVLIELDDAHLRNEKTDAAIGLQQAQADLRKAEIQVANSRAQLETAEELAELRLKLAQLNLEQVTADDGETATEISVLKREISLQQRLAAAGPPTGNPVVAEARIKDAEAKLRFMEKFVGPRRIAEARLELAQAKAESQREKAELQGDLADAEAAVIAAKTETVRAETRLARVMESLSGCRVLAPMDGVVVHAAASARRTQASVLEAGTTVRERQHLLSIPNLKKLQVRARVHESRIREVSAGQSVTIEFDALPGRRHKGVVKSIGAAPVPATWPNTGVKEYEVVVVAEDLNPRLKIGMTCVVEIEPGKSPRPNNAR